MRVWSIHPKYLDAKGLVALWRETLLAKNVLEDKTKGYKNHPQLSRFRAVDQPLAAINQYLSFVFQEARERSYMFDESKFERAERLVKLSVTQGQIDFEMIHLLKKLAVRDPKKYAELKNLKKIDPHPLFDVVKGGIEPWEIV